MLFQERIGHCDFEEQRTAYAFQPEEALGASNGPWSSENVPAIHTVHVVANDAEQKALVERAIFASGHHAKGYRNTEDLIKRRPSEGIVFAHESAEVGTSVVCQALSTNALWLPVIGFGSEIDASRIVAGMKAGAMDFLIGAVSAETIAVTLHECAIKGKAVSKIRGRRAAARSVLCKLSHRERQVLDGISAGLSNKEMAQDFGISPRTVEVHRMNMMGKIGATSIIHVVRFRIDALEA
jgi:two-component system, LuxR family, response regulator FixJ